LWSEVGTEHPRYALAFEDFEDSSWIPSLFVFVLLHIALHYFYKKHKHKHIIHTMSFISQGLRVLCSAVVLPGVGLIAMGSGVIPVDDDIWSLATTVIGQDLISPRPFLLVLGNAKILGVLGLWGIGPFSVGKLSYAAVGVPAACALYGHSQIGDGKAIGAGMYLCFLAALFFMSNGKSSKGKKL
jgi:hypothetical protein